MKNKILILIVLLTHVYLFSLGQNVFPTFSDNPKWYVFFNASVGGLDSWTEEYQYYTDTNICGYEYSYIKINGFDLYVRSDTVKAYVRINTQCIDPEFLLYDYSKSIGDTFYINYFETSYPADDSLILIITNIDTIKINGVKRIKYNITFRGVWGWVWYTTTWLKGIGSLNHPFYNFYYTTLPNSQTETLLCFDSSYVQLYRDPYYDTCYIFWNVGIGEVNFSTLVRIWPNPFNAEIFVDFTKQIAKSIEILSIYGDILYTLKPESKQTKILFNNQYKKGLYILKIRFEDSVENIPIIKL